MQLGMIGLGRMGASMVSRLLHSGHQCVVFDTKPDSVKELASKGAVGDTSGEEANVKKLLSLGVLFLFFGMTTMSGLALSGRQDSDIQGCIN